MMNWWVRPLVRVIAAFSLPFLVPLAIALVLWVLPGDPATNLCPEALCSEDGRADLVEKWHLQSATSFYFNWLTHAFQGDFGVGIAYQQGELVSKHLWESLPNTALVVLIALIPILIGTGLTAAGRMSQRLDWVWQMLGAPPAVILSLFAIAAIVISFGMQDVWFWRILAAGLILGVADGVLAASIVGTRSTFESEMKQRYVGIALLRGESVLGNALPNVLPGLVGQFRARFLHILSGTVIVEVVLQVNGLGDLLFRATLLQDFFVVLAAAWGYAIISAVILLFQGLLEVMVAIHVRRAPKVAA
jgi:peptide/nickel transport system permease protein